jgi:predicted nucleic acid-binding protein
VSAARVYIDTNVIIYYLHPGSERGEQKAKAFFLDVEQSKYVGVVSDFCRLEYLVYIKDMLAMAKSGIVVKKDIDVCMDKFDRLVEDLGLEEVSADALLATPFITSCTDVIEKCQPLQDQKGEWSIFNATDSLHAVLASRCHSDFLATLDADFRGLRDSVQPMVLWDKY